MRMDCGYSVCEWTADALQAVAGCALLHEPPACLEVMACSICGE